MLVWRAPSVSRALAGILTLYFVLWYLLPVCLSIALWDELTVHIVAENDFLRLAAIETGVFAAIILCYPLWQTPNVILQRCALYSFRLKPFIIFIAAAIGGVLTGYLYFTTDFGAGYLERNAFMITGAGTAAFGENSLLTFLAALGMVLVYAALVTPQSPSMPKWITGLLVVVVSFWVYAQLAEGSRMAMFMPVILFILYAAFNRWSRRRLWAFALMVGPILVVVMCIGTIAVQITRAQEANAFGGTKDIADLVVDTPGALSALGTAMGNNLVAKLDSFSSGALLLQVYGPGDAGFEPYAGALLAGVPRILYRNKPIPGSRDGTYAGHPGRLVAVLLGMDPDSGNTGVGMSSIAIWQLGYGGLILLLVANVINLRVLNTLFLSTSALARATAFLLIAAPSLAGLLATPDVILMNLQRLILIVALFSFTVWLLDKKAWSAGYLRDRLFTFTSSSF